MNTFRVQLTLSTADGMHVLPGSIIGLLDDVRADALVRAGAIVAEVAPVAAPAPAPAIYPAIVTPAPAPAEIPASDPAPAIAPAEALAEPQPTVEPSALGDGMSW
jgi:hypothetical protein